MPVLTLKFKENEIKSFPLQKGETITIGRKSSNTVIIENLAVSGHHAKVDSVGEGFLLADLQSKNGTFVNEQLINTHWLKHEDVVTIGKHTLVFAYAEDEERPAEEEPEQPEGMDQTMVMNAQQQQAAMGSSGDTKPELPESTADPEKTLPQEAAAVLTYLTGGQGEFEMAKKIVKIGKAAANDLVVGGLMVGQTAATISQRPNGYYLSYVSGMSKPKVNGQAVKTSIQLNDFDEIEIGNTKLQITFK